MSCILRQSQLKGINLLNFERALGKEMKTRPSPSVKLRTCHRSAVKTINMMKSPLKWQRLWRSNKQLQPAACSRSFHTRHVQLELRRALTNWKGCWGACLVSQPLRNKQNHRFCLLFLRCSMLMAGLHSSRSSINSLFGAALIKEHLKAESLLCELGLIHHYPNLILLWLFRTAIIIPPSITAESRGLLITGEILTSKQLAAL